MATLGLLLWLALLSMLLQPENCLIRPPSCQPSTGLCREKEGTGNPCAGLRLCCSLCLDRAYQLEAIELYEKRAT